MYTFNLSFALKSDGVGRIFNKVRTSFSTVFSTLTQNNGRPRVVSARSEFVANFSGACQLRVLEHLFEGWMASVLRR